MSQQQYQQQHPAHLAEVISLKLVPDSVQSREHVACKYTRLHRVHEPYEECADVAIAIPACCAIVHHVIYGMPLLLGK